MPVDTPTGKLVAHGRFEIGNIDLLLDLVSNLEADHVRALKQFPLNCFDAFTPERRPERTQKGRIEIKFDLKKKDPEIIISDYQARGMTQDLMEGIPTRIGSSEKREKWQQLIEGVRTSHRLDEAGYQAIGIYVYRRLCKYCMIVSRHYASGSKTYSTFLPTTHGEEYQIYEEPSSRSEPGTDVHLVGVDPKQWTRHHIERLKKLFRKEFRYRLLNADPQIELWVIEADKKGNPVRHRIMPGKFEGERLPEEEIKTFWQSKGRQHFDPTVIELYYHPGSIGGFVEVESAGNRICEDICKLDERLNVAPFNTGEVEGVVAPTFLLPDTGRGNVLRDAEGRFEAWVVDMRILAEKLTKRFEVKSREVRDNRFREFERNLKLVFRDVLDTFDLTADFEIRDEVNGKSEKPLGKSKKTGYHKSKIDQDIRDQWKKWIWELLDQGVEKLDEIIKIIRREHKIKLDRSTVNAYIVAYNARGKTKKRPDAPSGEERKRRAEILASFSLLYQPIWTIEGEQPIRSRFNETTRVLQVNNSHPDYLSITREMKIRKKADPAPLYRYIAELVAKELTPVCYTFISDKPELFDRFLDIRNAAWGRLNLLN